MEPMAVMEYCRPMGSPMAQSALQASASGRPSSRVIRRMGKRFTIYTRHATPDTAWDTTVAMAAPATPQSSSRMHARSSTMFSPADRARKYTGVRLSPRARMMEASRLYRNTTGMPMKIIKI